VIRRKTNRRHMIGDHYGPTAGRATVLSEPWMRFSARTTPQADREDHSAMIPAHQAAQARSRNRALQGAIE
jgi:hypothetical protein